MENNKTCILTKITALMMAFLMVFSVGFTPALAVEGEAEEYVASIGEELYETLQQAVADAEGETTVTLLKDANGDGIFVSGDKNITFDFGGFTYTVDGALVGSTGTVSQAMHLEKGAEVTLKNGTLKAGENVKFLIQNYCDLTVENMNLDVTGVAYPYAYALSNNCGNVLIKGNGNISSDYVAFDLWYNLMGAYSEGVSVTFDETFTGTVTGDIEYGADVTAEGWTEKTALIIKDGTFLGEFKKSSAFEEKANITAYGGIFADADVADYCAKYYRVEAENESYKVVPDYVAADEEGNKYFTLQQAVADAEGETTITLLKDANGDGIFVSGDKNITFDFGGFTYTVDGALVGSTGTVSQAMHLEKGAKVTLKNGTLKAGENVKFLIQNYCDLTVENMNLDVTGVAYPYAYALSNNCGNVLIKGNGNISSDHVAFDLWYNLMGAYSEGVSVTFDETFTGTVTGDIEYGADVTAEGWTEKTALTVKGGTFLGEIKKSSAFEEKANITAYGGIFADADVADYCAKYYRVEAENESYKVVPDYVAADEEGNKYFTLQQAVDAATEETTVTLLKDANGDGIFVSGDKNIIFDFDGFTYTVDGALVGSTGTKNQAMHLEKGAKVTLKNGTLKAGKKVAFLIQNCCDLTAENMNLDVTGVDYPYAYALSNNCGNVLIKGNGSISSDYVAFDLWYNSQGNYPEGVSVTFDETFTGTVTGDIEYGADTYSDGWTEKTALTIKGGTFLGEIKNSSAFETDFKEANITLYGGTYKDAKVSDYCAEDYKVIADGEIYKVVPKNYIVASSDGKKYEVIQEAVDAAEGETTVTLLKDANGDGIFVSGDKNITFDFGGFTYTVDGALVGSTGTVSQAMHLEKGAKVTLKNGTFKAGENVKFLIQNYCDLTVENMNLDVTGVAYPYAYALSNNCGNVLIKGNGNISSDYVAFDLWYNLMGAYSEGVSVTFDETFTGTVTGDIEYGADAYSDGWTEKTALTIKGGTFLGEIKNSSAFETDFKEANVTLYGGTYKDAKVSDYCAEHYKVIADGENYKVVPKNYIVASSDGKKYEVIQEAVDAAEGETTVTLLKDANGDGIFVSGDKNITFDFGGFTYTVDGALVGSTGTVSQAMHLEKGAKVTLKNGTLKAGENVKFLIQNYCDLTVENMNLDVKGVAYPYAYALSNNCGNVLIKGSGNISSDYVAFDLWYNLMGAYSEGVSVTFDETFTGTVTGDIEYGADAYSDGWTEKTALIIKGGTFLGEIKNLAENTLYKGDMNITLYGGYFTVPVMAEWCAEGSEPAVFGDGSYGPCFHDFTEKIEDRDHFCAEPGCENGNVFYYDCSKCAKMGGETFDDGRKLGHSFSRYIYNDDGSCIKNGTATAFCDRENCNGIVTIEIEGSGKHGWGEWTVTKNATCLVKGEEERICFICGEKEKRTFSAGHTYSNVFVTDVQPQCGKNGSKSRHCIYCDAKTQITSIPAKTHVYKVTVKAATAKADGNKKTTCTLCGKSTNEKIYRIKTVTLSKTSYSYTGSYFKPTVTVKDSKGKKLVNGKDYTVKYSSNKAVGKAKVTVTFKGNYSGTKSLSFSIVLAKVGSLKLTAKNDAMDLSWKTVKGAQGYQIISSTSKDFKKDKKTTYIKKQSTKKTTLKKLKNKKTYYVKIRAYRTVNGKKVYGSYSSVKSVKTK